MIELINSMVVYDEGNHTYHLGDKKLSGITGVLGKSIFFHGKFDNIPKKILESKRDYGSNVHKQIENYDNGVPYMPIAEIKWYENLKKKENIDVVKSEYIVTDGERYATPIDLIASVNDVISLIDHKTSYSLDKEYLSWQLSMCAFLLEKQTGLRIDSLYANHIKKGCKLVKIERKTDDELHDMFYTDKYVYVENPMPTIDSNKICEAYCPDANTLTIIESYCMEINEYEEIIKSKKEYLNELLKKIECDMDENKLSTIKFNNLLISKTKDYTRTSFNKEKFLIDHPELSGIYDEEIIVKGVIKLKYTK